MAAQMPPVDIASRLNTAGKERLSETSLSGNLLNLNDIKFSDVLEDSLFSEQNRLRMDSARATNQSSPAPQRAQQKTSESQTAPDRKTAERPEATHQNGENLPENQDVAEKEVSSRSSSEADVTNDDSSDKHGDNQPGEDSASKGENADRLAAVSQNALSEEPSKGEVSSGMEDGELSEAIDPALAANLVASENEDGEEEEVSDSTVKVDAAETDISLKTANEISAEDEEAIDELVATISSLRRQAEGSSSSSVATNGIKQGEGGLKSSLANLSASLTGESGQESGLEEAEVTEQFKTLLNGKANSLPVNPDNKLSTIAQAALTQGGQTAKVNDSSVALRPTASFNPAISNIQTHQAKPIQSGSYVTNLSMPIKSPDFSDGLAQKMTWFVSEKIQSAKIHINPADLGPVEMKIQVSKDQVHVQIQSPHAVVRDMLEGNAQRLRDLLSEQGIELGGFDVGSQQDQSSTNREGEELAAENGAGLIEDEHGDQVLVEKEEEISLDQLVDYYV